MVETFTDARILDLIHAINDNPTQFSWKSRLYNCIMSQIATETSLEPGGSLDRPTFVIAITLLDEDADGDLVSRFVNDDVPVNGDAISIRDGKYRLDKMSEDVWDTTRQKHLVRTYELVSRHLT